MNRGEVWWYEHPTRKPRPALIITRQTAVPVLETLLVVPATRTIRGIPTEVPLGPEDGMREQCVLAFDTLFTARKSLLTHHVATLGPERMTQVCRALAFATDCRL